MKIFNLITQLSDPKNRQCVGIILIVASLICGAYIIGGTFLGNGFRLPVRSKTVNHKRQNTESTVCQNQCRLAGSESLPAGIVTKTSNLELHPLWGPVAENIKSKPSASLLAIAVGIKQKEVVSKIVEKFLADGFVVMLFHYDDVVDEWRDLGWGGRVIHISALNQTKWWFAKRFLHPDIVADYDYIFLWDEDLEVKDFHPSRYLNIIKDEGLEISQPALDTTKSEVHHPLTARQRNLKVHRRYYKTKGSGRCDERSNAPPCLGWVEMMAPVFSRAAWRCAWYLIQNDLIHAWGLDVQLGYCAQGNRAKNVGVVDAEYIVHLGFPTLGISHGNKSNHSVPDHPQQKNSSANSDTWEPSNSNASMAYRGQVRKQSYTEMQIFKKRWSRAVKEDKCWDDPYQQATNQ